MTHTHLSLMLALPPSHTWTHACPHAMPAAPFSAQAAANTLDSTAGHLLHSQQLAITRPCPFRSSLLLPAACPPPVLPAQGAAAGRAGSPLLQQTGSATGCAALGASQPLWQHPRRQSTPCPLLLCRCGLGSCCAGGCGQGHASETCPIGTGAAAAAGMRLVSQENGIGAGGSLPAVLTCILTGQQSGKPHLGQTTRPQPNSVVLFTI